MNRRTDSIRLRCKILKQNGKINFDKVCRNKLNTSQSEGLIQILNTTFSKSEYKSDLEAFQTEVKSLASSNVSDELSSKPVNYSYTSRL